MSTKPTSHDRTASLAVSVNDAGGSHAPVRGAQVLLYPSTAAARGPKFNALAWVPPAGLEPLARGRTDDDGRVVFSGLAAGTCLVFLALYPETEVQTVELDAGCLASACFHVNLDLKVHTVVQSAARDGSACAVARAGDCLVTRVSWTNDGSKELDPFVRVLVPAGAQRISGDPHAFALPLRQAGEKVFDTGLLLAERGVHPPTGEFASTTEQVSVDVGEPVPAPVTGGIQVSMTRTETEPTGDLKLWGAIRASADALSFTSYDAFMELLFCGTGDAGARPRERARFDQLLKRRFLPFTDTDAYRVMKAATEAFVMVNCGVLPGFDDAGATGVLADFRAYLDRRDLPRPGNLPYLERVDGVPMLPYLAIIRRKLPDVPIRSALPDAASGTLEVCDAFIEEKLRSPCLLELIWSYWQEEGMLVQGMNAISRRFQNLRGSADPDPLANLEVNPLRPLNSLLWGWVQDEQHRLTVARRNGEYDHHYGLRLEGRAVRGFRGADSRSKFVEAFHHLLRLCVEFYKQDDDTTVKADAFGVLNALKEVHLILSQGAHSQFGELPPTARIEMMMTQWLLARPEFREFLPTRSMVAYPEPWMDRVDAMKKLMGWTETSVIHFHNLATFGEQLLLAIRYGAWSTVFEPTQAFNFARFWRPQVQGYIHAYRAATGVELGAALSAQQVDSTLPSLLLQRRLAAQRRSA